MAQYIKPIKFENVSITGGFWSDRQNINKNATLEAVYNRFKETGRFDALKCLWDGQKEHKPHIFWDSDTAKWIEGASYILAKEKNEKVISRIEEMVDNIEKNRDKNGYFNSYYLAVEPDKKFTVRINHELYCAGHLIEAAIAYKHATGRDRFLNIMCDYADYIYRIFYTENSAKFETPGHQEIEMALVRLYKETNDEKYIKLSRFFIDTRGNSPKETDNAISLKMNLMYEQSHCPVNLQYEAVGHCVRALYMYCGMIDTDEAFYPQLEKLFYDITEKKMYVTGGVGSTSIGEAFTIPYDLPNETAYNETCASIAMAMFAHRLCNVMPKGIYGDIVELELFNGILSGVSLDGTAFFYENPLSVTPSLRERYTSTGVPVPHLAPLQRKELFDCSCCPPNILRTIAKMGEWFYGMAEDKTLFVHQFAQSEAEFDGGCVKVTTNYPNDGRICIQSCGLQKIAVRIPGWCEKFSINAEYTLKDRYAYINAANDIIIDFEMPVVFLQSTAMAFENAGKVAVKRGPVVYCAEAADNGRYLDSLSIYVDGGAKTQANTYGGIVSLLLRGERPDGFDGLYRPFCTDCCEEEVRLVPYYSFANRGISEMRVWLTPKFRKGEGI